MKHLRLLLLSSCLFFLVSSAILLRHHSTIIVQHGGCVNIAAIPDYLNSNNPHDAIQAINYAHQLEHLPALRLPTNFYQLGPIQQQFLLLNQERTERKLQPLRMDATLSQIAQAYSRQMRDLNFFAHTSPIGGSFADRINSNPDIDNHYRVAAENLAGNPVAGIGPIYEYMYDDAVEACGHRDNILGPNLQLVGIGLVFGSPYGSISAQEFLASAPWNPYTGAVLQQVTPSISIKADVSKQGVIQFTAQQNGDDSLVRITWFLDSIDKPLYVGKMWAIERKHLPVGKHTILVYGVDSVQNYAVARYVVAPTRRAQ